MRWLITNQQHYSVHENTAVLVKVTAIINLIQQKQQVATKSISVHE